MRNSLIKVTPQKSFTQKWERGNFGYSLVPSTKSIELVYPMFCRGLYLLNLLVSSDNPFENCLESLSVDGKEYNFYDISKYGGEKLGKKTSRNNRSFIEVLHV